MGLSRYIGSQLGNPRGIVGKIVTSLLNIFNKKMYKKVVNEISLKDNDTILDIGFGNGYLFKKLYKKHKCDMYGIDISSDAVNMAIKKNKKAYNEGKLHVSVGDCCSLEFNDSSFEAITTINTIYFWSDTTKGLCEIYRALKDNGRFYNLIYSKEYLDKISYTKTGFKKFIPSELVPLGKEAGFKNIEIKEIVKNKSYLMIFEK